MDELIKRILFLPKEFHNKRDVSIYSLLKESGYFEFYEYINETNTYNALTANQQCIDDWISWSEDKRSNSGWYLINTENETFIVGHMASDSQFKTTEYFDRIEACAAFIKHEIEEIRKI